jgi:AcrR family transcriptional regulator
LARVKQRTPELRDRILHVALAVLAREGAEGLTARRVAHDAGTSIPAVYELFGDKAGLIRAIFFDGFRRLAESLSTTPTTHDPTADLRATVRDIRRFALDQPGQFLVMFARPFDDFGPGTDERSVGDTTRTIIVARVQRAIDEGRLHGDATDLSHVLLATCQGLALQESAGWLGTTTTSRNRRWAIATDLILAPSHH